MNLSDLLTPSGLVKSSDVGTSVQPYDAGLASLAGLATSAGKIPYATAADVFGLLDLLDEDDFASDSASGVPTQQSVKAYVAANGATEATAAQIAALTNSKLFLSTQKIRDLLAAVITPTGSFTPDWSTFAIADWVLSSNYTLNAPTNVVPGTTRIVRARGNSTTDRTLYFNWRYVGNLPELPVDSNSYIIMSLYAQSADEIWVSHLRNEDLA